MSSEALSGPRPRRVSARTPRTHHAGNARLPSSSRRRTGGLRREELSQISGISATLVYLDRTGREVSISPSRWRASPRRCGSAAERHYLFTLARVADPGRKLTAETASDAVLQSDAPDDGALLPAGRDLERRRLEPEAAALFSGWLDMGNSPKPALHASCSSPRWRKRWSAIGKNVPAAWWPNSVPRPATIKTPEEIRAFIAQHDWQQRGL